jgi:hypothetical protein
VEIIQQVGWLLPSLEDVTSLAKTNQFNSRCMTDDIWLAQFSLQCFYEKPIPLKEVRSHLSMYYPRGIVEKKIKDVDLRCAHYPSYFVVQTCFLKKVWKPMFWPILKQKLEIMGEVPFPALEGLRCLLQLPCSDNNPVPAIKLALDMNPSDEVVSLALEKLPAINPVLCYEKTLLVVLRQLFEHENRAFLTALYTDSDGMGHACDTLVLLILENLNLPCTFEEWRDILPTNFNPRILHLVSCKLSGKDLEECVALVLEGYVNSLEATVSMGTVFSPVDAEFQLLSNLLLAHSPLLLLNGKIASYFVQLVGGSLDMFSFKCLLEKMCAPEAFTKRARVLLAGLCAKKGYFSQANDMVYGTQLSNIDNFWNIVLHVLDEDTTMLFIAATRLLPQSSVKMKASSFEAEALIEAVKKGYFRFAQRMLSAMVFLPSSLEVALKACVDIRHKNPRPCFYLLLDTLVKAHGLQKKLNVRLLVQRARLLDSNEQVLATILQGLEIIFLQKLDSIRKKLDRNTLRVLNDTVAQLLKSKRAQTKALHSKLHKKLSAFYKSTSN